MTDDRPLLKSSERRLLRAICALPGRTMLYQPGDGRYRLGSHDAIGAHWRTYKALEDLKLIIMHRGAGLRLDVEATDAGRAAIVPRRSRR